MKIDNIQFQEALSAHALDEDCRENLESIFQDVIASLSQDDLIFTPPAATLACQLITFFLTQDLFANPNVIWELSRALPFTERLLLTIDLDPTMDKAAIHFMTALTEIAPNTIAQAASAHHADIANNHPKATVGLCKLETTFERIGNTPNVRFKVMGGFAVEGER